MSINCFLEGRIMNCLEKIQKKIESILKIVSENGGRIYLVGGSVRDILMKKSGFLDTGTESKDYDFCITGISQADFESLFPYARIQGKDFPVYVIKEYPGCEFSLARRERKTGKGYRGFKIMTAPDVAIEDDLIRRDLTINSIAYDFRAKKIVDPFHGIDDISNMILRAVSPSFGEDPLRVYRAARFSATFKFKIEAKTIEMMFGLKSELPELSPERVFIELRKALSTEQPSRFFKALKEAEVLDAHFKEAANLIGVEQPVGYHPKGDAFDHTMIVLDKVSKETVREEVRFAALVHDIGKGEVDHSLWPRNTGHDRAGAHLVGEIAKRLTYPNAWISAGKLTAAEHMRASRFNELRPAKKVEFIEKVARSVVGLKGLEVIVNADGANAKFADLGERMLKEVNGRTLNLQQGKETAKIIHQERVRWMETNDRNHRAPIGT